ATPQHQPADRVRVALAALVAPSGAATVAELVAWIARELGNFDIPNDDVVTLCAQAGVAGSAPASNVTADPTRLAFVVGIVFAHPIMQRR
ncbi:MAG: hypothetical protein GX868_09375, partial [Actinobacteria bacterium]|nr:hypothetical protein [Actinomycetota bacterium]